MKLFTIATVTTPFALGLLAIACSGDGGSTPLPESEGTGGEPGTTDGTGATDGASAGAGNDLGGAGNVNPGNANVLPLEGEAMTMNWTTEPYVFGAWFTYFFHTGTTLTPVPAGGIATTDGKMCASLLGTAEAAGGGAIGFNVCGAPLYVEGDSDWFPLSCDSNPPEKCVPSEKAMPISFCGGELVGVQIVGTGIARIEFKGIDDANMGATPAEHYEPIPVNGYVPAPANGGDVTAIHFKSFSDGEFCLESVELIFK